MASTYVKGITTVTANISRLRKNLPKAALAALYADAQQIEAVSRSRTPVLTGALRDSHETILFEGEARVTITVGGSDAPYAIYVHENLSANHPIGQAKFLETALLEAVPEMAGRIASSIDLDAAVKE